MIFQGVGVVVVDNIGSTVSFELITGVDTENSSAGWGIGPYVFTFEFAVITIGGGCCWFLSKLLVMSLSKNIPFSFFKVSWFVVPMRWDTSLFAVFTIL